MTNTPIFQPALDDDVLLAAHVRSAVRLAREQLGCATDTELADRLGIGRKYLSYWQNNKFNKNDRALARIFVISCNPS